MEKSYLFANNAIFCPSVIKNTDSKQMEFMARFESSNIFDIFSI